MRQRSGITIRYNIDMHKFTGFPREGIQFLKQLKKNNKRDWFLQHKHIYDEKVKMPMVSFLEDVRLGLRKFAPEMDFDPARAIFRIYRDVRFSSDKSPYKTHIAASINPDLPVNTPAGFYIHIEPGEVFAAGGLYHPGTAELSSIRKTIANDPKRLRRVLGHATFREHCPELYGERLSRAPRGFPQDHPALDLLRYKQYLAYERFGAQTALTSELTTRTLDSFRAFLPLIRYLNEALGASPAFWKKK